jgi:hypothetical protein
MRSIPPVYHSSTFWFAVLARLITNTAVGCCSELIQVLVRVIDVNDGNLSPVHEFLLSRSCCSISVLTLRVLGPVRVRLTIAGENS